MLTAGAQVSYVAQGKVLPTPAAVGVCWQCPCVLSYAAEPAGPLFLAERLPTITDTAAPAGPQRSAGLSNVCLAVPGSPEPPPHTKRLAEGTHVPLQWVPLSQTRVPVASQNICSRAD